MDHTQMEWSDSESENTEDRDFIDNSTVLTSTITQNTKLDDDPSTLISEMDADTKRIYLQKINDKSCTVRRSTRKRKRPKTWFENHTEDLQVYLEDTTIDDLVESSEQNNSDESETESYQPSDDTSNLDSSDNSDNSDTESN